MTFHFQETYNYCSRNYKEKSIQYNKNNPKMISDKKIA